MINILTSGEKMVFESNSSKPSHEKHLSSKPDMRKFKATFNGETITVIFARNDSCMTAGDYGIGDLDNPSDSDIESFWKRYYPSNPANGTSLVFRILPGMHTAPATHSKLYAETILSAPGQIESK